MDKYKKMFKWKEIKMNKKRIIIGAGGHAKVIADIVKKIGGGYHPRIP